MLQREITHADTLRQTLLFQLQQGFPGIDIMALRRLRPVDQVQIDIIGPQLFQAGFQRLWGIQLIVIPQFGGDKQLFAVFTALVAS